MLLLNALIDAVADGVVLTDVLAVAVTGGVEDTVMKAVDVKLDDGV